MVAVILAHIITQGGLCSNSTVQFRFLLIETQQFCHVHWNKLCTYWQRWIGHILRTNCLLKQVIEGKIKGEMELTRRRGRRRKKLLDDLKDRRGYSHLKEEAVDRTMWRNRFRGGFGPVVRQNTE